MKIPLGGPKIATKFLTWFLLAALLPLGVSGYIIYRIYERNLKKEVINNLIAIADNRATQIENYILERERNVSSLAHAPTIIDAMEKYEAVFIEKRGIDWLDLPEYLAVDKELRPFLTYYKEAFGFSDLFLICPDGDVVFSVMKGEDLGSNYYTGIYRDTELAKVFDRAKTLLETAVSDFEFYPATNTPVAFIAAPVLKEARIVGVVVFQMSNEEIYALTQDYTGLGETGETVIASRKGNRAIFVSPLRHDPYAAFRRRVAIGSREVLPIQEAVQGKKGFGTSIDYRGKEILAAWKYLPHLRWGMVVKMDTEEAFSSITNLRNWIFSIGAASIFVVVLVALFISKTISDPIVKLTQTTKLIAGGDLTKRVDIRSGDEIGLLGQSFNKMAEDLKVLMQKEKDLAAAQATAEVESKRRAELEKAYKELKEMQERLIRSEKLTALGKLAGIVSHELRNPLGAIRNSVYFLKLKLASALQDEKIKRHLDILDEEVTRSDRIITNILAFGRIKMPQLAVTDFNEIIKNALEKIKVPENIELIVRMPEYQPQILADGLQLGQVFGNIITNAIQAMPKGGRLTIIADKKDRVVEIVIADTGDGIPPENLNKIFEPLFSTRPQGTGLGLTVCQNIIEAHKGIISVESELGKGTTFRVKLPAI